MSDERWTQLYVRNGASQIVGSLYELVFWHGFMALIGLGSAALGLASWLGLSKPLNVPWYAQLGTVVVGAVFGVVAARGAWASLLDLVGGVDTWEGPIDGLRRVHISGQHGGYSAFRFGNSTQTWELAVLSVPEAGRHAFETRLKAGCTARVRFTRGTRQLVEVSAGAPRSTQARAPSPETERAAAGLSAAELARARDWATSKVAWWSLMHVVLAAWLSQFSPWRWDALPIACAVLGLAVVTPFLLTSLRFWFHLRLLREGTPTPVLEGPHVRPASRHEATKLGDQRIDDASTTRLAPYAQKARARVLALPSSFGLTNAPQSLVVEWLSDGDAPLLPAPEDLVLVATRAVSSPPVLIGLAASGLGFAPVPEAVTLVSGALALVAAVTFSMRWGGSSEVRAAVVIALAALGGLHVLRGLGRAQPGAVDFFAQAGPCSREAPLGCARACDEGEANACDYLGLALMHGVRGMAKDPRRAMEVYSRGCELGSSFSCFEASMDVSDRERSLRLERRACDLGFPEACDDLSRRHLSK